MVATISRDGPAVTGDRCPRFNKTGWRDALFVEAIADDRGRATALQIVSPEVPMLQNEKPNNSWRTGQGLDRGRAGAVAMAGCFLLCPKERPVCIVKLRFLQISTEPSPNTHRFSKTALLSRQLFQDLHRLFQRQKDFLRLHATHR